MRFPGGPALLRTIFDYLRMRRVLGIFQGVLDKIDLKTRPVAEKALRALVELGKGPQDQKGESAALDRAPVDPRSVGMVATVAALVTIAVLSSILAIGRMTGTLPGSCKCPTPPSPTAPQVPTIRPAY